jgi:hypothetical protein
MPAPAGRPDRRARAVPCAGGGAHRRAGCARHRSLAHGATNARADHSSRESRRPVTLPGRALPRRPMPTSTPRVLRCGGCLTHVGTEGRAEAASGYSLATGGRICLGGPACRLVVARATSWGCLLASLPVARTTSWECLRASLSVARATWWDCLRAQSQCCSGDALTSMPGM